MSKDAFIHVDGSKSRCLGLICLASTAVVVLACVNALLLPAGADDKDLVHACWVVVLQCAQEQLVHGVVKLLPGQAVKERHNRHARAERGRVGHGCGRVEEEKRVCAR